MNTGYTNLMAKAARGETVYLINSWEQIAYKWERVNNVSKVTGKIKGGAKFAVPSDSELFADATLEGIEITASQFENY